MQTIMLGLKSVPGVMGAMLSDSRGNLLAHSFPDFFDQSSLKSVSELVNDNSIGLQEATGEVKLIDIRTELGRIIVKSMPRLFITVLSEQAVNLQLLIISLNVAVKKLEKFSDEQLAAILPKPMVQAIEAKPETQKAAVTEATPVKKHWIERMQDGLESKMK